MSNWPITPACGYQTIGLGTGTGTTVTSGGANTKGSYATIGTATIQANQMLVSFTTQGTSRQYRVDIAVNTGSADDIKVADWFVDSSSANVPYWVTIPVAIPSGAVVKMRCQSNAATQTISAQIVLVSQGWQGNPGARAVISATDWTNTLPTNSVTQTGTTYTAWTTVAASLSARISYLWVVISDAADGARTASDMNVDIGIGSSPSAAMFSFASGQSATKNLGLGPIGIPVDIASGTALKFRVQCSAGAADAISMSCMGLAA